jgi:hypothetical protein
MGRNALLPMVNATALSAVDITSGTSAATTETDRLLYDFILPFYIKGRLVSYYLYALRFYVYVDTVSGTYYYNMYVQPQEMRLDYNTRALEPRQLVGSYSCSAAATAGWTAVTVNASVTRRDVNLPFEGFLRFLIPVTSYSTAGSSGHGYYHLNDPWQWRIYAIIEVDE